jgi:hypothetical protein
MPLSTFFLDLAQWFENFGLDEPSPPSRLLLLPTELKLQILRHRLLLVNSVTNLTHGSHSERSLLPLVLVSKELHNLAFVVYHGENIFALNRPVRGGWSYPNPAVGAWLRKVEVRITVQSWKYHDENYPSDWKFLLEKENKGEVEKSGSTQWQRHFAELATLKVVLDYRLGPIHEKCFEMDVKETVGSLSDMVVPLRAKKVEVEVVNLRWAVGGANGICRPGCTQRCRETMTRAMQSKLRLRED